MKSPIGVVAILAAGLLAAGCGSKRPTGGVLGAEVQHCHGAEVRPLGSARVSYAAVAERRLNAFRRPGRGRFATFGTENVNGVPTVFGVLAVKLSQACAPQWFRVELPQRPNGVAGWVRARDVEVARVHTRIVVEVSARRLTLFRDGKRELTTRVAVGSPATPTPTGRYYVNQRLVPADTSGPFGPGAIGISAFSNVLTGWAQGGPIAIHGTNAPWSIGHAVSNGCIRVQNDMLRRIFQETLAGTPVIIYA